MDSLPSDGVLADDWRSLQKILQWFEENKQDMSIPYTDILLRLVKINIHLVTRVADLRRRVDHLGQ